jgi:aryl-alcohol dehydrogenase-like predicted oxidoreductase
MLIGRATPAATRSFAARFGNPNDFYRQAQGLTISSLGIGTYLGSLDDAVTRRYTDAVCAAVEGGINVIDTSLNYRRQLSERAIGVALIRLQDGGKVDRDELLICTKAGFLVPDSVPAGLRQEDIAGGMHSLHPAFLADQLERSRLNLGVETVDVFYLHNPETQLEYASYEVLEDRLRAAFEQMERLVAEGKVGSYGTATWDAFRTDRPLELLRLVEIAREIAGPDHHFRFIQLPFNFAMTEALTHANQSLAGVHMSALEAARRLGLTVIASASLLQRRLINNIPPEVAALLPGPGTDAQRAIQFVRSTPGITTALVGMSRPEHVSENLAVASFQPMPVDDYVGMFRAPD